MPGNNEKGEEMAESVALTLRLPKAVHDELRKQAYESRVSISEIIRQAIESRVRQTTLGCDVCGRPHKHITTPGGFRFCDAHMPGGQR